MEIKIPVSEFQERIIRIQAEMEKGARRLSLRV